MKSANRSALMAGAILGLAFCLATSAAAQKDEGAAARAAALQPAGKHSEAIPLAQHVLVIREKQLGPDDPDLVSAITRLETLNPNDPRVPRVLGRLGRLYLLRHRDADAERVLRRAQVIMEQAPGYYPPEQLAFVLKNLGAVYLEQHRDHDAESLLRRALAIREKEFGP